MKVTAFGVEPPRSPRLNVLAPSSDTVAALVAVPLTEYSARPPPGQLWNVIEPVMVAPAWLRLTLHRHGAAGLSGQAPALCQLPAKFVIGGVVAVAVGGTAVAVGATVVAVGVDVCGAVVAVGGTDVAAAPGAGVLVGALVAAGRAGVLPVVVADGDRVAALVVVADGLAEGRTDGELAGVEICWEAPGLAAPPDWGEAAPAGSDESPSWRSAHQPSRAAATTATPPIAMICFHAVRMDPRPKGPGPPSAGGGGTEEDLSGGSDVTAVPRYRDTPGSLRSF